MTDATREAGGNGSQQETSDINVLKSKDDRQPWHFVYSVNAAESGKPFQLCEGYTTSCVTQKGAFGPDKLRTHIEPWLTALFQSEHLNLLVGSGLSQAVHCMARKSSLPGMNKAKFSVFRQQIDVAVKKTAEKMGRGEGNIEDQIRVVNELLRGLECYVPQDATFRGSGRLKREIAVLKRELSLTLEAFAKSILNGEESIATSEPEKRREALEYLVSFLMSFASRTGTRDRLQIFTTNYDRLLETGAEVAGLHLIDRFVGSIAPLFRSSRLGVDMHYNPPGIRGEPRYLEGVARFTKLHGSVDWVQVGPDIRRVGLPFGAGSLNTLSDAPGLEGASACELMIYPNAAKDSETAAYPYVELFRDYAAAICRPNSTLVTYGYSFGDEHINRMIRDMMTIPSTHLVIISFDDPMGRIMKMYESIGRPAQITLLLGKHLGDLRTLVDHYLPKPAIDKTTFKMAELLKARLGVSQHEKGSSSTPEGSAE